MSIFSHYICGIGNLKKNKHMREIKLPVKDAVDDLKKVRSSIAKYIYENEPEVNKADFLLQASPINKSCPTISKINEYEKILNS